MSTIQVKLLNDGGWCGGENVKFPVVVEATKVDDELCEVHYDELVRIGFEVPWSVDNTWPFIIGSEYEVVS